MRRVYRSVPVLEEKRHQTQELHEGIPPSPRRTVPDVVEWQGKPTSLEIKAVCLSPPRTPAFLSPTKQQQQLPSRPERPPLAIAHPEREFVWAHRLTVPERVTSVSPSRASMAVPCVRSPLSASKSILGELDQVRKPRIVQWVVQTPTLTASASDSALKTGSGSRKEKPQAFRTPKPRAATTTGLLLPPDVSLGGPVGSDLLGVGADPGLNGFGGLTSSALRRAQRSKSSPAGSGESMSSLPAIKSSEGTGAGSADHHSTLGQPRPAGDVSPDDAESRKLHRPGSYMGGYMGGYIGGYMGGSPMASGRSPTGLPLSASASSPYLAVWKEHLTLFPPHRSAGASPGVSAYLPARRTNVAFPADISLPALPSDEEVIAHLGTLRWFEGLSPSQLQTLHGRAGHKAVPRYSAIIREGNIGSCFYLLLAGQIRITSEEFGISFVLPDVEGGPRAGRRYFGEAALVTSVRREATVIAVEDCYLLSLTSADMQGLPVNIKQVRVSVISKMLLKVPFFKDLSKVVGEQVSAIMDIEYVEANRIIFPEGGKADKLYIIIEGKVAIFRRHEDGVEEQVCSYSTHAMRPTFGELALWSSQPRRGTARSIEPTNLLVIKARDFRTFLSIVPEFSDMFASYASAFDALNLLKVEHEAFGRELKLPSKHTLSQLTGALGAMLWGGGGTGAENLTKAERAWVRVLRGLMANARICL